jgi:lipopolysaccharide export LptBFGC system permease protein LptF
MNKKIDLNRIDYITGIVAILLGTIDPLEGSVLIVAGTALITFSLFRKKDKHFKIFLTALFMIIIGVFFLFYLSSLGGIGGNSDLSWWWGLLIIPYPLGWILSITMLILRMIRKRNND